MSWYMSYCELPLLSSQLNRGRSNIFGLCISTGYSGSLTSGAPSCSAMIILGLITKSQCCTKCLILLANLLIDYQQKELHFYLCAFHWHPDAQGVSPPFCPLAESLYCSHGLCAQCVFPWQKSYYIPSHHKTDTHPWTPNKIKQQSHRPQALGAALLPCAREAVGSLVFWDCCS